MSTIAIPHHTLFIDGALVDSFNLVHGFWEAKDISDDLDKEIKKKFDVGYPKNNILFQAPNRIVIWQDGQEVFDEDVSKPEILIEGLKVFFEYEAPAFEQWQQAVEEFKLKVRELATGLLQLIEKERQTNSLFIQAFNDLVQLCQETINPNISIQAVEEMLIQHLLTERIFRKVFNNPDFVERNVIAHEIEKVISALTSQYFSRVVLAFSMSTTRDLSWSMYSVIPGGRGRPPALNSFTMFTTDPLLIPVCSAISS